MYVNVRLTTQCKERVNVSAYTSMCLKYPDAPPQPLQLMSVCKSKRSGSSGASGWVKKQATERLQVAEQAIANEQSRKRQALVRCLGVARIDVSPVRERSWKLPTIPTKWLEDTDDRQRSCNG
jgi:hypothetical protein